MLEATQSMNLNIDSKTLEACLKAVSQVGGTTYQNICTGQSAYVGWGGLDWIGGLLIVGFTVIVVVGAYKIIRY